MRIQLLERRVFIIVSAIVRFSGKVRGGFASKRQISIFAPVMALYARRRCLYQGAQTRHGHGLLPNQATRFHLRESSTATRYVRLCLGVRPGSLPRPKGSSRSPNIVGRGCTVSREMGRRACDRVSTASALSGRRRSNCANSTARGKTSWPFASQSRSRVHRQKLREALVGLIRERDHRGYLCRNSSRM